MTDFLENLPKALSAEERAQYELTIGGGRVLALIDALTAHLAEAVARMTVAEKKVNEDARSAAEAHYIDLLGRRAAESERDAALARAEAMHASRNEHAERADRAESEAAALRALCGEHEDAFDDLLSRHTTLRAENERLRAEPGIRACFQTGKVDLTVTVLAQEWESMKEDLEVASALRAENERLQEERDEYDNQRCAWATKNAALRAELDDLARAVGEALGVPTLTAGESMPNRSGHAIVSAILDLRAENERLARVYQQEMGCHHSHVLANVELRAENERLRAELSQEQAADAELRNKLAAANALLAEGPGFMKGQPGEWPAWCARVEAHLAGSSHG